MNSARAHLILTLLGALAGCVGETIDQLPLGIGASCGAADPCAAGLECEVEHGVGTCQPHGGPTDAATRADAEDDGPRADASPAGDAGTACRTDQDCPAGLECEVEHGVGACQPHGRRGRN